MYQLAKSEDIFLSSQKSCTTIFFLKVAAQVGYLSAFKECSIELQPLMLHGRPWGSFTESSCFQLLSLYLETAGWE